MKYRFIMIFITLILLSCTKANRYYQSEPKDNQGLDSLKVGAAVIDITPLRHLNVDLSGYGSRLSEGVHDPITC